MAALVAEGIGCLLHQILFVSSIFPSELFELAPFGSFRYRRSRHPDLNKYIDQLADSVQVLLAAGANHVETVSVTVSDEGELVAEWIIDIMVKDVKNVDGDVYKSWIGSIAVKMQQMSDRVPSVSEPCSRTFAVNVELKHSLSSYRLGADLDWVLADTKPDNLGLANIYPCKSFRSPQIAVHSLLNGRIVTFIDERISQDL